MKSTKRFESVPKWTPVKQGHMQQTDSESGSYVALRDYNKLLQELQWERKRLKSAGELINKLMK